MGAVEFIIEHGIHSLARLEGTYATRMVAIFMGRCLWHYSLRRGVVLLKGYVKVHFASDQLPLVIIRNERLVREAVLNHRPQ